MNYTTKQFTKQGGRTSGFTMLEMLVVLALAAVLTAIAVPNYLKITQTLRISGDLRDLNGIVGQAKMHAAADFTHGRAHANLQANTFQLEIWNKAGNGGAGCWQTVGDTANPCTAGGSPVQTLSSGVTFGFGGLVAPPPNTQVALAQAPLCLRGYGGGPARGAIEGTACIEFNSRGIAIDAAGNPTGNGALYLTNRNMVYGLTMAAAGPAINWFAPDGQSSGGWHHQ